MELVTKSSEGDSLINMNYLSKRREKIKKNSLVHPDDWPFLSLQNINKGIAQLSAVGYRRVCSYDSRLMVSLLGTLPTELVKLIVYKMVDNDKQAAKKFMSMPVIDAFQEYQTAKSELGCYPQLKDKSVGMWFALSEEQKNKVLSFSKQSLKGEFLFADELVMTQIELDKLNELDKEVKDEYLAGQQVLVIDQSTELFLCPLSKGAIAFFGGFDLVLLGGMYAFGVPLDVASGVVVGATVLVLGGITGIFYCHAVKNFQDAAKKITL